VPISRSSCLIIAAGAASARSPKCQDACVEPSQVGLACAGGGVSCCKDKKMFSASAALTRYSEYDGTDACGVWSTDKHCLAAGKPREDGIECTRCGLLRSIIPDVCQSVCLSRGRAVQKRLNKSRSCSRWRLLETPQVLVCSIGGSRDGQCGVR